MEAENKVSQERVKAKAEKLVAFAKELQLEIEAVVHHSPKGSIPYLSYHDVEKYEEAVEEIKEAEVK